MSSNASGVLAALLTVLIGSLSAFPFTEATRRLGSNALNHFRLLLASIILTILCWLIYPEIFTQLFSLSCGKQWFYLASSAVIGLALGDFFGFSSLAILGPRISSIFGTFSPGAALLFGYLIIGEKLNIIGIIGMSISLVGALWITLNKKEKARIPDMGYGKIKKGISLGIFAALCQGIGIVLSKKGLNYPLHGQTLPAMIATWMRVISAAFFLFLYSIVTGKLKGITRTIASNEKKGLFPATIATIFGLVICVSLTLYSITLIKVSVAQTILSLGPVAIIPFAWLFYKEKVTFNAVAGAVVAIIGVFILIWRDDISRFILHLI